MAFDAEREVTRLWKGLQGAQAEAGANWFRWRQAVLSVAGPDADSLQVSLKALDRYRNITEYEYRDPEHPSNVQS